MSEVDRPSDARLLLVQIGGEGRAIPAGRVVRIVGTHPIARTPFLPSGIGGVVAVGGKVIPLIAPGATLGLAENSADQLVLVTVDEQSYALPVDRALHVGAGESGDDIGPPQLVDLDALPEHPASPANQVQFLASVDMAASESALTAAPGEETGVLIVETETSREFLPLDSLVEIGDSLPVVAIPDPIFAGAILHRDCLVPAISLDALLGRTPAGDVESFVIVEAGEGCRCALGVKRVVGLSPQPQTDPLLDLAALLANLLRRPASAALPKDAPPKEETDAGAPLYLLVELDGRTCAFALGSVAHVHTDCPVLKVKSAASDKLVGATAVGGRILPVIDLAKALGISCGPGTSFVELKSSNGEPFLVAVNRIVGTAAISQDAWIQSEASDLIGAVARHQGKLVWILQASLVAERGGSRHAA